MNMTRAILGSKHGLPVTLPIVAVLLLVGLLLLRRRMSGTPRADRGAVGWLLLLAHGLGVAYLLLCVLHFVAPGDAPIK